MRVVLLGDLDFGEEVTIEFECRGQVVQRLLKVSVLQVCFTQFRVGCDQDEQILLVDVHEKFAESKLLDAHLDDPVGVLAHGKLIKSLVALEQLSTDAIVHLCVLLLSI